MSIFDTINNKKTPEGLFSLIIEDTSYAVKISQDKYISIQLLDYLSLDEEKFNKISNYIDNHNFVQINNGINTYTLYDSLGSNRSGSYSANGSLSYWDTSFKSLGVD
jgi:hypothetical protein